MDIVSGDLRMDLDTGLVRRRVESDGDTEYEPCGFVGCDWDCPPGCEGDWEILLDRREDARRAGAAYLATVRSGYYDRLSLPRMN